MFTTLPEERTPAYQLLIKMKISHEPRNKKVWFLQITSINNIEKALTHLTFGMDYYPSHHHFVKKE